MTTLADLDAFWRDVEIGHAIERAYRPATAPKAPCRERTTQRQGRDQATRSVIERIRQQPPGEYPVAHDIATSVVTRLRAEHPDLSFRTEHNRCLDGKRVCDILAIVGGAR